jgi:hypothetical protein
MNEKFKSKQISRRTALSFLGLAGVLSLAVPPTVLIPSNAEAQQAPAPAVAQPAAPETGMERRQGWRKRRRDRRQKRREHRKERREERRTGGVEKK